MVEQEQKYQILATEVRNALAGLLQPIIDLKFESNLRMARMVGKNERRKKGLPVSAVRQRQRQIENAEIKNDERKGYEHFCLLLSETLDELAQGNTQAPRAFWRVAKFAHSRIGAPNSSSEFDNEMWTYLWLTDEIIDAWDKKLKSYGL